MSQTRQFLERSIGHGAGSVTSEQKGLVRRLVLRSLQANLMLDVPERDSERFWAHALEGTITQEQLIAKVEAMACR